MSVIRYIGLILVGISLGGLLRVPYIGRFYFVLGSIGMLIVIAFPPSNQAHEGKAEKLDAIETLIRGQPFIMINRNNQYSIQPRLSHKGTEIISEIMAILFPDEVDEE